MTDDELLTFDYERLAGDWTRADGEQALALHGEVYRAQLVAAHFAERWCNGVVGNEGPLQARPDYLEGFANGLHDMAAHLRMGQLLPGGVLYQHEMGE